MAAKWRRSVGKTSASPLNIDRHGEAQHGVKGNEASSHGNIASGIGGVCHLVKANQTYRAAHNAHGARGIGAYASLWARHGATTRISNMARSKHRHISGGKQCSSGEEAWRNGYHRRSHLWHASAASAKRQSVTSVASMAKHHRAWHKKAAYHVKKA